MAHEEQEQLDRLYTACMFVNTYICISGDYLETFTQTVTFVYVFSVCLSTFRLYTIKAITHRRTQQQIHFPAAGCFQDQATRILNSVEWNVWFALDLLNIFVRVRVVLLRVIRLYLLLLLCVCLQQTAIALRINVIHLLCLIYVFPLIRDFCDECSVPQCGKPIIRLESDRAGISLRR